MDLDLDGGAACGDTERMLPEAGPSFVQLQEVNDRRARARDRWRASRPPARRVPAARRWPTPMPAKQILRRHGRT